MISPYTYPGFTDTGKKLVKSRKKTLNTNLIEPEVIIRAVCRHFHVKKKDLMGRSRKKGGTTRYKHLIGPDYVTPRQVAQTIMRLKTDYSWQKIGKYFNRDHATVIHSFRQIGNRLEIDEQFREDISPLFAKVRVRVVDVFRRMK